MKLLTRRQDRPLIKTGPVSPHDVEHDYDDNKRTLEHTERMMTNSSAESVHERLEWREVITIGKGPLYQLQEKGAGETNKRRVAGWVQLNEGKYEAVVPGLPSEAMFNKSITADNSAVKIGVYNDMDAAKSSVEKHLPNEEEWTYL
jgi:hypothetical protein